MPSLVPSKWSSDQHKGWITSWGADHHDPKLISVCNALSYMGVGRTLFYEIVKSGDISPVKIGRRTFVVKSELDAWIANLPRIGGKA
ncbi:helix-turn-helix transcriptional regulator [Phenylobacterium sp.]|uniref:helix-turn-helix transcriptional regulator n=1 Tax=Phenylobacterium sp. TaxID=1871053 RepID=UPI0035AE6404